MPDIDRIPVARSVVYAVRGMPDVQDEYNATRTITPTEISLTYRAAEDSQLGRVHAYVKGWWMEDGARVPMDKPVGRHFWGRDFDGWPEWLAAEARLHDPDRVPADRAAMLREEAALIVKHCPDHGPQDQDGVWMDCHCAVADDMERRANKTQQEAQR